MAVFVGKSAGQDATAYVGVRNSSFTGLVTIRYDVQHLLRYALYALTALMTLRMVCRKR